MSITSYPVHYPVTAMNHPHILPRKLLLCLSLMCCLPTLSIQAASATSGVINIIGRQGADFEITKAPEGGSTEAAQVSGNDKNFFVGFPLTHNWKQFTLTITPKNNGRILVLILGPYAPLNPGSGSRELSTIFVHYDDFKVEGAELKNGSFEKLDKARNPIYWDDNTTDASNPPITDSLRAAVSDDGAPDGKYYARVWHNSRYLQALTMQEGVPITITFYARLEKK